MLLLFTLLALANAEYVVVDYGMGTKYVMTVGVCMINMDDSTESGKVVKNGDKISSCVYANTNCSGEGQCQLVEDVTTVDKVPANIAYMQVGQKADCSDHKDMPAAQLFTSECSEAYNGMYAKYAIENKQLILKAFTDNKCETPKEGSESLMVIGECDKCDENEKVPHHSE